MHSTPGQAELFVVFNPGSGCQDKGEAQAQIEDVLRAAGRRYRFIAVENGDVRATCLEAARQAAAAGGAIVSVGGDGTLNAAAQAALAEDCLLGVIPQGTFNLFARDHGIPLEATAAAQALLDATPRDVHVGTVNQRLFVVNASLGLYPKLLADREEAKSKLGRRRWVAALAGLFTFFRWHHRLKLDAELDGRPVRIVTASLFVCNNRMQIDSLVLGDELVERVKDGWLAAITAPPLGVFDKLRVLAAGLLGRLDLTPRVDTFAFHNLTVSARHARKMRVSVDGEVCLMELPLRIAVSARRLRVLLPPVHAAAES